MKLFIAIPTYAGTPIEFTQSLMKMQAGPPCDIEIKLLPGDSLVCRARNTLTAAFLKSDCTHLLFIDSDLIFSSDQIKALIACDKPVIGGFYPKKKDGPVEWVCNDYVQPKDKIGVLRSVRYMGTGFLLIRREVIEKMIEKYGPRCAYHPDHNPKEIEYDLWPVGVYTNAEGFSRYLSEDWYFCQRWLDLGGEVFGHTNVILKHIGQAIYPMKSQLPQLLSENG